MLRFALPSGAAPMTDTFGNHKHVIGLRNWPKWTTWKGSGYCCVRVAVGLLSFIIGLLPLMAASAAHTHMLFYLFPADKWPLAADFLRSELEVHLQSPPASAGLGLPAGFQLHSNTSAQNILFFHDLQAYFSQKAHCWCCVFLCHLLFMWLFHGESSVLVRMMVIILI